MNVLISLAEFLTLTEVISIRNLRFFALASNNDVHNLIKREVSREKLKSPVKIYSWRRQMKLRSNTHGCELINVIKTAGLRLFLTPTFYLRKCIYLCTLRCRISGGVPFIFFGKFEYPPPPPPPLLILDSPRLFGTSEYISYRSFCKIIFCKICWSRDTRFYKSRKWIKFLHVDS